MQEEVTYMLGVVLAGFAVNFGLRALPFLLFAGGSRRLPGWVERFGAFVSPVIIAVLVVYSYSGLQWRTPWPYVAGAVTVGLQLLKRNPLASIVAGTAVYMLLLNCCGCATRRTIELNAQNPAVRVTLHGVVFGDRYVDPQEVPDILEDYDVPHDRVIHIQLDPDVRDLRQARMLMGFLSKAGYTRPVLVTKRHAESVNLGKARYSPPRSRAPEKSIRYKKASE
ncbi:MAG: AzlD domain-containing protein [Kiritimatiellae bacterium]|nr:AzlD domain-containing protein [Kiritimatiellia bacterium]